MSDQVAVVVGAGPGLGLALGKTFAGAGMRVALALRSPGKLEPLGAWADGMAMLYGCDAADPTDVDALFEKVEAELGTPSVVVFNAGTFEPGGILEVKPQDFERCWRIGCFGGFLVGQAAARRMAPAGAGTIIFTGATASLRGSARFVNLASPKFGLRAVAQSMARELGPKGLHIAHVIIDGQIDSERYRHLAADRGPDSLLSPDAIAENYLHLHRQPRSAWTFELDLRPWVERF